MDLSDRINAFAKLGEKIKMIATANQEKATHPAIIKAVDQNPWFTTQSVIQALTSISGLLTPQALEKWTSNYSINKNKEKLVGLVLAGNIPLVGFHDILSVLISGNRALAKLSSKDSALYYLLKDLLTAINPNFDGLIEFTTHRLENIDAIIATGSDNTARYFEYYFQKYPHIIRKNRNSVGILSGNETTTDLHNLGLDIFTYFGLGCRNVSFLLVPENYNFTSLINGLNQHNKVINHSKYANNYDYQKAIHLMNNQPIIDGGFFLLKNKPALSSPIGIINYMEYNSREQVNAFVEQNTEKIQCVLSKTNWPFNTYAFGEAQQPELNDYADNVDTLEFLLNN